MKDIDFRYYIDSLGLTAADWQLEAIDKYMEMVLETNKVLNLTAITDPGEFALKHIADSLSILKYAPETGLSQTSSQRIIDVGTGAGFPGIPLKIMCPELRVTLLDSLNKRVVFLNSVIDELGLTSIEAVHMRAEEGGRDKAMRDSYDIALSRAVANLSALSEYTLPFVRQGGCLAAYKSGEFKEELEQAGNAIRLLNGEVASVKQCCLPDSDIHRSFIIIKKKGATPKAYPRKPGSARSNPL